MLIKNIELAVVKLNMQPYIFNNQKNNAKPSDSDNSVNKNDHLLPELQKSKDK